MSSLALFSLLFFAACALLGVGVWVTLLVTRGWHQAAVSRLERQVRAATKALDSERNARVNERWAAMGGAPVMGDGQPGTWGTWLICPLSVGLGADRYAAALGRRHELEKTLAAAAGDRTSRRAAKEQLRLLWHDLAEFVPAEVRDNAWKERTAAV